MTVRKIKRRFTILRRKQVQAKTGLPRSTMYLEIQQGRFPKPVPLGERSVGWVEDEIDDAFEFEPD